MSLKQNKRYIIIVLYCISKQTNITKVLKALVLPYEIGTRCVHVTALSLLHGNLLVFVRKRVVQLFQIFFTRSDLSALS